MNLWHVGRQHLTRTVRMTMLIASLAVVITPGVSANQGDDAMNNAITQIQVCKAMGGTPEVNTKQTGGGEWVAQIICHGGYMDGFSCMNIIGETWCQWDVMEFSPDHRVPNANVVLPVESRETVPSEENAPLPTPDVIVNAPVVSDPTATPTAEPTDDVGSDPAVDDEEVSISPTVDVSDGDVAPVELPKDGGEADSGDQPIVPDVLIEIEDQAPAKTE